MLAIRQHRSIQDELDDDWGPGAGARKGGTPLVCPSLHINGSIDGHRRVAFARIPLDDVEAVRRDAGATVNDMIHCICAGAPRRYLDRTGALPDGPLVAGCPVNGRTQGHRGAAYNRISAMFTPLHTDIEDSVDIGFLAAARLAPDVAGLAGTIGPSLAELVDALGP